LNVNQSQFENLPQASSLFLLENKIFDRETMLISIANQLEFNLKQLPILGETHFWNAYHQILFKKDVVSAFESVAGNRFVGKIQEVTQEDKLKSLFVDDSEYTFTVKETDDILKAISEVKILDPACGSGAFPMGALHKIVKLLQKLDKGAVWWKAKQKENAARVLDSKYLNDFNEKIDNSNSDYARKLGVIQHSIYGVDIQPIAAEISKLRSFLSLIIDENIDDNAPNRGIEPLPNLEFKFVTANTLISLDEGKKGGMMTFDFGETTELQNQLQQLRNTYLQASPQEKENLKQQFEQLQTQIYKNELKAGGQNKRAQQLAAWKPFSNESSSWFDPDWMFGVEKFDVVIGNPPYVQLREVKKELIDIYKKCKYHKDAEGGRLNLFQYFISLMLDLTKDKMITSFIVQNSLMAEETTKNIRKILLNKNKIITIDSFPERDNPKKRVFEGVKMSVCVGLVSKNFIKEDYFFDLNIWEEKHMINLHSLRYSKNQTI
jgi:23S rRNA G2445 N2-methylase RlmL